MKRVLCPKCENYLFFDETKYSEGQSLVFECEHCGKQFSIRLGKSKVKALRKEENLEEEAEVHKEEFGYITVIENVFGFKQVLHTPLTGNRFQFAIVLVSRRRSDLIGCHYGNVVL